MLKLEAFAGLTIPRDFKYEDLNIPTPNVALANPFSCCITFHCSCFIVGFITFRSDVSVTVADHSHIISER